MKRLLLLCLATTILACKEEPKDYVTLSGKIENAHESKILKIFQGKDYEKIITINDDGTFSDTLKVKEGDYTFQHGEQYGPMYLKNDFTSSFETDNNSFIDSMLFKGDGSDINNLSVKSFLLSKNFITEELLAWGNKDDLDNAIKNYKSAYEDMKVKYADVDSTHLALTNRTIEGTLFQVNKHLTPRFIVRTALPKGTPSPDFVNYENHAGGDLSLSDLKGKYVYMDIWATWCPPCIKEIPSLQKVEKQFHGKNIEFVSISVDEGRGYKNDKAAAYQGWRKMVTDKELTGIQLMADNGFSSDFIKAYKINGIPRFILLDPKGNIISADAPRPSDPALVKKLLELGL